MTNSEEEQRKIISKLIKLSNIITVRRDRKIKLGRLLKVLNEE